MSNSAKADKYMKEGDSHSSTGLLKWKPNWGDAAESYKAAAKLYERDNKLEEAAKAHLKESYAFYKYGVFFHAGVAKREEAKNRFELKDYNGMMADAYSAHRIFMEDGKPDQAGDVFENIAKNLQKAISESGGERKPRRYKRKKKKTDDEMEEDDEDTNIVDVPSTVDKIHKKLEGKELFYGIREEIKKSKFKEHKVVEVKVKKEGKSYTYTKNEEQVEIWGQGKEYLIYYYEKETKQWPFLVKAVYTAYEEALKSYVDNDKSHYSRALFDEYTTTLLRDNEIDQAIKNQYDLIPACIDLEMPHRVLDCQMAILLLHISKGDFEGAFKAEQDFLTDTKYTYAGSLQQETMRNVYDAISDMNQEAYDKLQRHKNIRFLLNELKNRVSRIKMTEELAQKYANSSVARPSAGNEKLSTLLGDSDDEDSDEMDEEEDRQHHPLNENEKKIKELEEEDNMEEDEDSEEI
mmetsp:Transcript_10608/g.15537  ORF Transcript_10608/g.15537 Transcript_10608/m.15537 type:complete len:464 (+) Transcript_10608:55-1446(+)